MPERAPTTNTQNAGQHGERLALPTASSAELARRIMRMACRRGGPAGGLADAGEGGRAGSHERYRLREQQSHEMVLGRRVTKQEAALPLTASAGCVESSRPLSLTMRRMRLK